jgi:excisionase family DNA binding protein
MEGHMTDEKLLSVFEAEAWTGRKASTWRRDIAKGRVGRVKIGRQVRIPFSEVQRLISTGYRGPTNTN